MNAQRMLDLLVVAVLFPALVLSAPILWLAGKWSGHSGLLFTQVRVGRGGEPMRIPKFRTLTDGREEACNRLFRWVRAVGIDELPQILLIARGRMSCVGPRPLLLCDLFPEGEPVDRRLWEAVLVRQSVPPGLTGVSQTLDRRRGRRRGEAYWTMLNGDVWYVERRSLALDVLVLGVTLIYVASSGRIRFPRHRIELDVRRCALPPGRRGPERGGASPQPMRLRLPGSRGALREGRGPGRRQRVRDPSGPIPGRRCDGGR